MLGGGVVALPAAVVLSVPFGAMELMLPVMLTGMTSGMLLGMLAAMGATSSGWAAALGAIAGLVVLAATYALNAYVRASHRPGTTSPPSREVPAT
jgi:O-antigen/teichoic acid export membrane protein